MKAFILAAAFVSTAAFGADIVAERSAYKVPVDSVAAVVQGATWPETSVKVQATFGNPCFVPHADELIRVVEYSDGYGTLELTLLSDADRACTLEFNPTTVTIDLGTYVRPNDGNFGKVVVNGVEAVFAD